MNNQESNLKYIRAKNKVDKEKGFYSHLIVYLLVNIAITIMKIWNDVDSWVSFNNELTRIDVFSVWLIWGIFLLLHFISFKFGQGWEERKIEALMKKELSKNSKE